VSSQHGIGIQISIAIFIFVILGFNYLMFFFQIKKRDNFFKNDFWKKAPFIFIVSEIFLVVLFISFGVTGDLFIWVV